MCAKIIDINKKNIDEQVLFCKKTKTKLAGYKNKVKWMKERFKEGLKYKILIVKEGAKETSRGMIEYIPGEYNWRGIQADGWMVVHCLWVVGKHKGKGHGFRLLEHAINDAKEAGMYGVVGMTADKGGWLPNKKLYENHGFEKVADQDSNFHLYALYLSEDAPKPKFTPISKVKKKEYSEGVTVIYSDQCPYVVDLIDELREEPGGAKVNAIKLESCKDVHENKIYPYGTFCISCNGSISLYKNSLRKEIRAIINE